jgi:hypothetical protein
VKATNSQITVSGEYYTEVKSSKRSALEWHGSFVSRYLAKGKKGEGTISRLIAYLADGSDLNKLRQTIDILKSHGIKIGGYLPCATFAIDATGQLYWTHPTGNSTAEFEQARE